jgi:hypothetical protein
LLLTPFLYFGSDSSADEIGDVLIFEVNPFGDGEGISLFNYGQTDVNLKDWEISDGEGHLIFIRDLYIKSNSRLTFVKGICEGDWFSGRDGTIVLDDDRIQKKGSFILSNTGDDVYLYCKGVLADTVCYGNKKSENGWMGNPADISSNRYLLRLGSGDTNSDADWISTKPGITNHAFDPDLGFDSEVTAFSFPESQGSPIFEELERAECEVLISMYLLTSVSLVALLCKLSSERDVNVRILLEGNVLGYDISKELMLVKSVADAGGTVHLINDNIPGNPERYSYFHNKYAVIDGRKVIVTSENWTSENLSSDCSNRGWGVIVDSPGLADYMRNVFFSDLNPEFGDVSPLMVKYPGLKSYSGTLKYDPPSVQYMGMTSVANVMPVLSPDNSLSAMKYLADNSENRVYSQQMDLGSSYAMASETSPLRWLMNAADRGIDVRLILDSSIGGSKDDIIGFINSTSGVKSICVNGGDTFSLIHNKGIIADDMVWVGSVNWTENSFLNNREFAVIIRSAETADFFADLFMHDWGTNEHTVAETGLEISYDVVSAENGILYIFTVSGPEDSVYTWDVVGDGTIRKSNINKIVCKDIQEGTHTASVVMDGTEYSATYVYTAVHALTEQSADNSILLPAAALVLAAVGLARIMMKRRNNNR